MRWRATCRLALEGVADDERLEMHAVVALDVGAGAGQALFDELADGVGGHGRGTGRVREGSRVGRGRHRAGNVLDSEGKTGIHRPCGQS